MNRFLKIMAFFLSVLLSQTIFFACSEKPGATLHAPGDSGYIPTSAEPLDFRISSGQAFVYDVEAGQYLYVKGESRVLYPASTTKLLTILYALTLLPPDEKVTPGNELELVASGSSIAYIKSHHTLTVEMLVEGMLLPSGNDAAYALAAAAGRKLLTNPSADGKEAVSAFMDGMNAYAKSIGLCGSAFQTPDGNAEEAHFSTVEDMTIVARVAAENELIMRYAGLAFDDVIYESGETNHWVNTNLLVNPGSTYYWPNVTGLKTGSLGKGKYSVIVTAEFGEKHYIIGVFASESKESRFRDAQIILDGLKKN